MIVLVHKRNRYRASADEVRKNLRGEIIAVHIPLIGWKDAKEFEIEEEAE